MVRAPWRRQKVQAQRPTRISSGFLSEVKLDLDGAAMAGTGIGGHGSADQGCPEVIDVGAGRSGDKAVAQHFEEAVAVIVVEHGLWDRGLWRARGRACRA